MQCLVWEELGMAEAISCYISPFIAQKSANICSGDKKCCCQVRVELFITSPYQPSATSASHPTVSCINKKAAISSSIAMEESWKRSLSDDNPIGIQVI